MADQQDDQLLQNAVNYLGNPTSIGLKGASNIATTPGSPTGIPAMPAGPGGAVPGQGGKTITPFGTKPNRVSNAGDILAQLGPKGITLGGSVVKNQLTKNLTDNTAPATGDPTTGSPPNEIGPGGTNDPTTLDEVSGGELGVGTEQAGGVVANLAGTTSSQTLGEVSGGELALGADAVGGAVGAGVSSLLDAYSGFGAAYSLAKLGFELGLGSGGPTSGNPYIDAATGLLGPYGDALSSAIGEWLGPSEAWKSFGSRLGQTLTGEAGDVKDLITGVQNARTQGDITQLVDMFNQTMGSAGVPNWQPAPNSASGAPQIGTPPGATGKRHEGNVTANFDDTASQVNNFLNQAWAALPAGNASSPNFSYSAYSHGFTQAQEDQYQQVLQSISGQDPSSPQFQQVVNNAPQWMRQWLNTEAPEAWNTQQQQAAINAMTQTQGVEGA